MAASHLSATGLDATFSQKLRHDHKRETDKRRKYALGVEEKNASVRTRVYAGTVNTGHPVHPKPVTSLLNQG